MANVLLKSIAIGTSLTLAGAYVAYQTGCIRFSRGDSQTIKAGDVSVSDLPRQVLIAGPKSGPVGPTVVNTAQPTTRTMLISGSKSLVLTPQQEQQVHATVRPATSPAPQPTLTPEQQRTILMSGSKSAVIGSPSKNSQGISVNETSLTLTPERLNQGLTVPPGPATQPTTRPATR
jgi:hypothetical protein